MPHKRLRSDILQVSRKWLAVCLPAAMLAACALRAQQKTPAGAASSAMSATYSAQRETLVQGTVVSFTTDSVTAPLGTHVLVQTASGTLDVHLGNGKLLALAKISLNPGDSVRLIGEEMPLASGDSFFAARVLRKGSQSVTLRSGNGTVLRAVPHDPQGLAALRGVR